jgi:hypothetical protein
MAGEYAVLVPPIAREAALQLLARRESSARVALLAAASNMYFPFPLSAPWKEDEGQLIVS